MNGLSVAQGKTRIASSLSRFVRLSDERIERVGLSVDPIEIRSLIRQIVLDLVIEDHAANTRVDDEHLTGP